MQATAPPTASSPEEAIFLLAVHLGRELRKRYPGDVLDAATWPLVHTLSCHGDLRLTELAARLQLDASTVSRHVKQLEDRGLVERTDDPDDRRAARVQVTQAGIEALEQGRERRRARIGRVLADWQAQDVATLSRLASRFTDDLVRRLDDAESSR